VKSPQTWPYSGSANRIGGEPIIDLNQPCDPTWLNSATVELSSCLASRLPDDLALDLRRRVAAVNRVPIDYVHLFESVDRMLVDLLQGTTAPRICCPPSASATLVQRESSASHVVSLVRGLGLDGEIDVETAADLPADGLVIVDSPSDPLGSILTPNDAVRLARACRLVIVDERYGEFSNFTLRGLASEFHNFVILRSYERWLGNADSTCGWAIASRELLGSFDMTSHEIDPTAMAAALALLNDRHAVQMTIRLARQERSRLYRLLRKFSFLSPVPSWGPFMSARVSVVPRAAVVRALLDRGIRVHSPEAPGLEDFIRIGIGSRTAMERVRLALTDMGPELLA
jgi:histidinol-phosphate/aromatic aminotransferase/cobyric acid decarboxylase-like protein